MIIADIVNNDTSAFPIHEQNSLMNITTHTIEPETIYSSFDLTTTDEATFSRSPPDSTTESSNLLKTTTTYEAETETSGQGATTTKDQSTHDISSQTASTLDPYTSESLRPGTTTTNTQVIETLSHASTAITDSKRNEMSTQIDSTTSDLHTTTVYRHLKHQLLHIQLLRIKQQLSRRVTHQRPLISQ